MEANFLRFLIQELRGQILGKRLEKIYQPIRGLWSFKLGSRSFLLLLTGKKQNCLFYSSSRPENPAQPDPGVQWWRKRLSGRRLISCVADWPRRRIAWELSPGQGRWLVMDLVQGLCLAEELDPELEQTATWPDLEEILGSHDIYRSYPQLTPPLRHSLQQMDQDQARELLDKLAQSRPPGFYVCWRQTRVDSVLPWKLPASLALDLECREYSRAIDAAWEYGWSLLQDSLGTGSQAQDRSKRLRKAIKRLEKEQARLQELASLQEGAYLLQNNLGRIDRQQKLSRVQVFDAQAEPRTLELDPSLSVLQNMQLWFKKGAKARRGLQDIARRKQEIQQELEGLEQGSTAWPGQKPVNRPGQSRRAKKDQGLQGLLPSRARGLQVRVYKSSQGFILLRGKNQKANHKLLSQAAKPFDYWFHVQDGAGAHVILLRDSPMQEVAWQSMQEAAVLAGLASSQGTGHKAEVCCALVKSVRKTKGAPLGQVQVSQIEQTFLVELAPELEERLRVC